MHNNSYCCGSEILLESLVYCMIVGSIVKQDQHRLDMLSPKMHQQLCISIQNFSISTVCICLLISDLYIGFLNAFLPVPTLHAQLNAHFIVLFTSNSPSFSLADSCRPVFRLA